MKKLLIIAAKALGFFILWGLSLSVMSIPAVAEPSFLNGNAAFLRLWWELLPLLGVIATTAVFVLAVEKNKVSIPILNNPVKNIVAGFVLGVVWLGAVIIFLFIIGAFTFNDKNNVPYLPVWFVAVLFNVIMQNYLVRGYLFVLLRSKYNSVAAVIVTTVLFTAIHVGAFEAGIVAVLNVATMSVFVSLLLIYAESLLVPIIAHFIWNGAGRLIFGVVSMADDYPNLRNCSLSGNNLISGGSFKIEGSIVVLTMNLLLIIFIAYLLKKRKYNHVPDTPVTPDTTK